MKYIQGYNHSQLINIGSDGKTLINAMVTAQNQLHQDTQQRSNDVIKENFKKHRCSTSVLVYCVD